MKGLMLWICFAVLLVVTCKNDPTSPQNSQSILGNWVSVVKKDTTVFDSSRAIAINAKIVDSLRLEINDIAFLFYRDYEKRGYDDGGSHLIEGFGHGFIVRYNLRNDSLTYFIDTLGINTNATYLLKNYGDSLKLQYLFGDTADIGNYRNNLSGVYIKTH
jgi:hypothetical protein